MKRNSRWSCVALCALTCGALAGPSLAQVPDSQAVALVTGVPVTRAGDLQTPVEFRQRSLSGPRLGVTYVFNQGELWERIEEQGYGQVISQFGWHFERQIVPRGGGPQFVLQAVPMVAGVEYGKLIPGITGAMGVRFPSGYEFGIGPNVVAVGGAEGVGTSLVIAVGKCFDYGGVSLPLNLALSASPEGKRMSFIVGYAIQKVGG